MPHLEPEVHLYAIREAVVRAAGISPTDLPDAFRINSGYAVVARTEQVRDRLVAKTADIIRKISCDAVEVPTRWHTYLVREVPKRLRSADGLPLLVSDTIKTEVETQTRQKPVSVRMSRYSDPSDERPTASWLVSFLEPVSRPFRLFSQSRESVRLSRRSKAPKQCDKCFYWHGSRMCSNSALCLSCGHARHAGECREPTQCPNCKGPYAPAHTDCAARPVRKDNKYVLPSKVELAGIKRTGLTAYARANLPPRPSPTLSTQGTAVDGTTVPRTPSERDTTPRRSGPTHDIALNIAAAENADVILLQEPSCMAFRDGSARTKTHPLYDCYSPIRHWTDQRSTHPRVLTYTERVMACWLSLSRLRLRGICTGCS